MKEKIHENTDLVLKTAFKKKISPRRAGKEIAIKRLHKRLIELNKKPKKRIPTRATKTSNMKRIKSKKIHSLKKVLRQKPKNDE